MLSFNRFSKISILLTLFAVLACSEDDQASLEVVHYGDVFLNTQAAMDRFASFGYTKVVGNLKIGSGINDEISDLTSIQLLGLTQIEGVLSISQTNLINLNGLSALNSVSSDIIIKDNLELTDLVGLQSLSQFDAISISNNEKLENLDGLLGMDSISTVNITGNPMLNSISGLSRLRRVGGNLILTDNPLLTELDGLDNLISVKGQLEIIRNGIESLSGLQNLEVFQRGTIIKNPNLTSLLGLDKLESVGVTLQIIGNENLSTLDGLQALEEVGSELVIRDNNALTDFCAISTLISLQGLNKIVLEGNSYNPDSEDFRVGDCEQ